MLKQYLIFEQYFKMFQVDLQCSTGFYSKTIEKINVFILSNRNKYFYISTMFIFMYIFICLPLLAALFILHRFTLWLHAHNQSIIAREVKPWSLNASRKPKIFEWLGKTRPEGRWKSRESKRHFLSSNVKSIMNEFLLLNDTRPVKRSWYTIREMLHQSATIEHDDFFRYKLSVYMLR